MSSTPIDEIASIGAQALRDLEQASALDALEQIRISVLGKSGRLSAVLRKLGEVPGPERPKIGAAANEWKQKIEAALDKRKSALEDAALGARLASESVDSTLPAREPHRGSLHPLTQVTRRVLDVFARLGFEVATGPEIETDFLNFEAVNIPPDHPARDMQDTFFMGPGVVLRTHTTPVQMRSMRERKWPVRIVCPGAVYRRDNDATHSPMFHQIEGLWIDRGVRMSDLKGTLEFFAKEVFGPDASIRLRPSYFPFVEPGAEVDVSCIFCRKRGRETSGTATCRVCKGTGWLEILGAGMVHPRLYENAGFGKDDEVSGFAFGMGVERIAMLLHRIPDLRLMYTGDLRFLSQF